MNSAIKFIIQNRVYAGESLRYTLGGKSFTFVWDKTLEYRNKYGLRKGAYCFVPTPGIDLAGIFNELIERAVSSGMFKPGIVIVDEPKESVKETPKQADPIPSAPVVQPVAPADEIPSPEPPTVNEPKVEKKSRKKRSKEA